MISLYDPVSALPLIGPSYSRKLDKLDIKTVQDLLHHYPSKYLDRTQTTPIIQLQPDVPSTFKATVLDFKNVFTRRGKNLQQATVGDETGQIQITWFNQRYLKDTIKIGHTYAFSGKPRLYRNNLTLSAPEYEHMQDNKSQLHTGRLVPIYPETAGVSSKWLRSRVKLALKNTSIIDHLPQSIIARYHLTTLSFALKQIHFPQDQELLQQAKNRLAFDELFFLQLHGAQKRSFWQNQTTRNPFHFKSSQIKDFISQLPFNLTSAQKKASKEILSDLQLNKPMNRLLEGDVGSGKTVVAAIATYSSYLSGFKTILMAPTEILAQQHFKSLRQLFKHTSLKLGIHTGSHKSITKTDLTIGTHALLFNIQQDPQIGLVIIDEQHRFGVKQRAILESLGSNPHRLTMSATPIPRTVALTLYGDLDVSIIDTMPKQRLPVKTWIVPESKRIGAYSWLDTQIQNGGQAFVICPLIDPSEAETLSEVKSATQEFELISSKFSNRKIGLLHGRLKSNEKDSIIHQFEQKQLDILVSTPVIEVGIDIPNATVILIEAAERFGLAQLHQLRGRVGRGVKQSYCLLFTSQASNTKSSRLKALTQYNSGFKLASIDLKIRGPGEVFGLTQHGFSNLKLARLSNKKLLQQTKTAAESIINQDPKLADHPLIKQCLKNDYHQVTNN